MAHQAARNRGALALTAGQLARQAMLHARQTHVGQRLTDLHAPLVGEPQVRIDAEAHVLIDSEVREQIVIFRHAFRNASLPLLTLLGPLIVNLLMGSFFIETIFRIPGLGSQTTLALYNRDYPMIMALILLWTFLVALAYLITDLLYGVVDPRIRLAGR